MWAGRHGPDRRSRCLVGARRPSTTGGDRLASLVPRIKPSSTDSIGRVLGGRHRLVTVLGTGAPAHAYLADDESLHRWVASKVLHPAPGGDQSFFRRFRAEVPGSGASVARTEPDGAMLGTARYAPPGLVAGWALDSRAGVHALALVLDGGVTGEAPSSETPP